MLSTDLHYPSDILVLFQISNLLQLFTINRIYEQKCKTFADLSLLALNKHLL